MCESLVIGTSSGALIGLRVELDSPSRFIPIRRELSHRMFCVFQGSDTVDTPCSSRCGVGSLAGNLPPWYNSSQGFFRTAAPRRVVRGKECFDSEGVWIGPILQGCPLVRAQRFPVTPTERTFSRSVPSRHRHLVDPTHRVLVCELENGGLTNASDQ